MYDHTKGPEDYSGKVLFFKQTVVEAHDNSDSISADLESAYFEFHKGCKLRFWVFKNSNDIITVTLQDTASPNEHIIAGDVISHTYSWVEIAMDFSQAKAKEDHIYKAVITSTIKVGDGSKVKKGAYISIDDTSFSPECTVMPYFVPTLPTLPGGSTQTYAPDKCPLYTCKNIATNEFFCLKPEQICDFKIDCTDHSDEM